MKISDLDFFLVEVPCGDNKPRRRSLLLRLELDSGIEGWGETALPWRSDELSARRDWLLPQISGRGVFDLEEILNLETLDVPELSCALDIACWDAMGKLCRQPVCHLNGGLFRNRIPLAVRLHHGSPEELVRAAGDMAEQGYHTLVLSSTKDFAADVHLATMIRDRIGHSVRLHLHCGDGYDWESALELCREITPETVNLLIDPLRGNMLEAMTLLRRESTVPLAIERFIHSPRDVFQALRLQAAEAVVIDPLRVGGLLRARQCATVAAAGNIFAILAGHDSLGIGVAARLHLAAACSAFDTAFPCDYHQVEDDLLIEAPAVLHGMMTPPQSPGLGITLDRAKLDQYQVG